MTVRAHTEYTYDVLIAFNNMLLLRRKPLWITLAALGGTSLGLSIAELFSGNASGGGELKLLYLVIAAWSVTLIAYILAFMLLPRLTLHSSPSLGVRIDFSFDENGIDLRGEDGKSRMVEHTHIDYGALCRVVETRRFYFLFAGNAGAYAVDKWHITGGCDGDLGRLLSDRTAPGRFKARKLRMK